MSMSKLCIFEAKMDWNQETVTLFLDLIRERPVIWDVRVLGYRDRNKKHVAWEEIALLMNCPINIAKAKWSALKTQYSREKRNMTGMRTGSGVEAIYTTKWFAFKDMEILMDGNTPEQTYNNLSELSSSPPTPPLLRSPSTPTPLLLRPSFTQTEPLLRSPSTPKQPLLRPPSTQPPPLLRPHLAPTPPLLQPPSVPTPPPMRPPPLPLQNQPSTLTAQYPQPIPPAKQKGKRKNYRNTVYKEAIDTLNSIRQNKVQKTASSLTSTAEDSNTSFGLYVASRLRDYSPRMQFVARNDINRVLRDIDSQILEDQCKEQQTAEVTPLYSPPRHPPRPPPRPPKTGQNVVANESYDAPVPAVYTDIYDDESDSQIEHVYTTEESRSNMDHDYTCMSEYAQPQDQQYDNETQSSSSLQWPELSESQFAVSDLLKFNKKHYC